MTEPEDLDEDLFADLYDGEDNAAQTASIPPTIPSAQHDELDRGDAIVITDGNAAYDPQESVDVQNGDEHGTNGASVGASAGQWDNGQQNDFGAISVDHGSHGTGIKEDG